MEKASLGTDVADEQINLRRQRIFEWYMGVGMGLVLLAVPFGGKLTTPIHSKFSGGWSFLPLMDWAIACMACAIFIGIVSVLLERAQREVSEIGKLAAGSLLFGGVCLFCAQLIIEGANIHFDSSPVGKVTTQIIRIKPAPSGSKLGATLYLAGWGGDANKTKIMEARYDGRIFHMDADKKFATFYFRKGFFGFPYAIEYK